MTRSRSHPRMQRLGLLTRRFGFDGLVVVADRQNGGSRAYGPL